MGDRFALMTDGIWGTVSEPILVSELTESSSAENTVAGLVERTDGRGKRKGGKHDNLTLAVIDVEADPIDKRNIWKYMFLCIMGCMVVLVLISGFRWLNAKSVTGQVVAESDTSKEVISDMKSGEEPQISSVDNFDTVDNQPVEVVNPSGNQSNRPKTSLVTVDITSGTEILGCISEIKQTLETLKNYGVDNVISQKNNRTAWNECKSHREALLNDVLTNLGTLAKKCDDPMKMHVKEIINLLKDKNSKVIYPDKKYGRTTREGAEVIDESIKKLNKLTNQ